MGVGRWVGGIGRGGWEGGGWVAGGTAWGYLGEPSTPGTSAQTLDIEKEPSGKLSEGKTDEMQCSFVVLQ